jgi:Voltage-dependent anion channel
MALMTVGAGTLILGRGLLGPGTAVGIDWVLWLAGTGLGLVTTCWIPFLMMTRHDIGPDAAFGGWLMPVVPPMVSAATGALLIPHLGSAQGRLTLLLACYAMAGGRGAHRPRHGHRPPVPAHDCRHPPVSASRADGQTGLPPPWYLIYHPGHRGTGTRRPGVVL